MCDNSNEVEEEEEDSNGSSSSPSTNVEDHQQDSNGATRSGTANTTEDTTTTTTTTGNEILEIAVPALAGLAIDPFMTVMDTIFVGRTSTNAAALVGMGSAAAVVT